MTQFSPFALLDPEASALLVDSVGADEFGPGLLALAHSGALVQEVFGYLVRIGEEPRVIVSQSKLDGAAKRVAHYVERFYRHDPAVQQIWNARAGESFMRRIALSSIIPHDYRRICFSQPGFSEKLSYGWRGDDYIMVLSFYRQHQGTQDSLGRLAALASLTLAVLVKHHVPVGAENAQFVIERRLRRAFPSLSRREIEVCARTLLGWSSNAIGETLGISCGTVLTYRQRAYQKTGFTKAGDFVPAILN